MEENRTNQTQEIHPEEGKSTHPGGPACLEVKMTCGSIFDVLLYHMYSTFGGFIINVAGLAVILIGGMRLFFGQTGLAAAFGYMFFGVIILCLTPLSLRMRAGQMMKMPKYQGRITYCFDDTGIRETMTDGYNHYGWDQVEKAINTPKTISFYMQGGDSLLVFPKEAFSNACFRDVMWYLSHHVVMGKIYIR